MTIVFIIREQSDGLWVVDRDGSLLIKHRSAAAAILDGRQLARMIHEHSSVPVAVALETPDKTILLARYSGQAPVLKLVAA